MANISNEERGIAELSKSVKGFRFAGSAIKGTPYKAVRVLKFISKWGKSASPFNVAYTTYKLHKFGVSYWRDVRKAAKKGRALLKHIKKLEQIARVLKKVTTELARAEYKLPNHPLPTDDVSVQFMVTKEELEYVEKYYHTAGAISHDASKTSIKLREMITGWDAVLKQANNNNDFTRRSAWQAINTLELKFSNSGGSFRVFIVNTHSTARNISAEALDKMYYAAHILGKWTPSGYKPPEMAI